MLRDAIAARGRASVTQAQAETWLLLERLVAIDPELRAELERARAAQVAPVRDRAAIVRACTAGALRPDEAVELFKRTQGG